MNSIHKNDTDIDSGTPDLVVLLRYIWQVRWGAVVGALILSVVALSFSILKNSKATNSYISVLGDQTAVQALTPAETVAQFNNVFSNRKITNELVSNLSSKTPQFSAELKSSLENFSANGTPLLTLEIANSPDTFNIITPIKHLNSDSDANVIVEEINDSIQKFNQESRLSATSEFKIALEDALRSTNEAQGVEIKSLQKNIADSTKIKIEVAEIIGKLPASSKSNAGQENPINNYFLNRQSLPYYELLIDSAFLDVQRAVTQGKISIEKSSEILGFLTKAKLDLNDFETRIAVSKSLASKMNEVAQKSENSFIQMIEARYKIIPSLKLNKAVNAASAQGSSLKSLFSIRTIFLIIVSAVVGAIVGSITTSFYLFIRNNWSQITK